LKKVVSGLLFILLITSMLTLAFDVPSVKATGTIYIRADGSIDPPTAPILRQGELYTLTGNIGPCDSNGIIIERDNIILDGAGFSLQGTGVFSKGVDLSGRSNVTIKNMKIEEFYFGIYASSCSLSMFVKNNITNNVEGIFLYSSSNNNAVYEKRARFRPAI
jgi:parallel beta-helix repeat protein